MKYIDKIISEIYKEFSGNKPAKTIDACTLCCMSKEDVQKIRSYSLREIPLDLLKEYNDAAKPEKLNFSELKYFAPRYLKLISKFKFPSFEPLLSLSRFGYFKYSDWTLRERNLLDEFSLAFLKKYINTLNKRSISPIEFLLMFHKGNFKIDLLLKYLEKSTNKKNLIFFNKLLDGFATSKKGALKVNDPFADKDFNKQICNWIESEPTKYMFRYQIELEAMNPTGNFTEIELQGFDWKYEMMR